MHYTVVSCLQGRGGGRGRGRSDEAERRSCARHFLRGGFTHTYVHAIHNYYTHKHSMSLEISSTSISFYLQYLCLLSFKEVSKTSMLCRLCIERPSLSLKPLLSRVIQVSTHVPLRNTTHAMLRWIRSLSSCWLGENHDFHHLELQVNASAWLHTDRNRRDGLNLHQFFMIVQRSKAYNFGIRNLYALQEIHDSLEFGP